MIDARESYGKRRKSFVTEKNATPGAGEYEAGQILANIWPAAVKQTKTARTLKKGLYEVVDKDPLNPVKQPKAENYDNDIGNTPHADRQPVGAARVVNASPEGLPQKAKNALKTDNFVALQNLQKVCAE